MERQEHRLEHKIRYPSKDIYSGLVILLLWIPALIYALKSDDAAILGAALLFMLLIVAYTIKFIVKRHRVYWMITEEGIEECGLRGKKHMCWESGCFIGVTREHLKERRGHTIYFVVSRHMPDCRIEDIYSGWGLDRYNWPAEVSIKIPWNISTKDKEKLKECVMTSAAPEHIKNIFLSTWNRYQ